ncbi:TatD family hydrolase [Candidatus Saccharibacteria bacterium]|nr:TatD family hydrolase [Candidatus Saccharibacteria bacterium]
MAQKHDYITLVDTHCHLHFSNYSNVSQVIAEASKCGVTKLICVGTTLADSRQAAKLAAKYKTVWASAGVHPHEADRFVADKHGPSQLKRLLGYTRVVAVGEIGLDLYKNYSAKDAQERSLRLQIESSAQADLPYIFHVREAWDDFWRIFDSYESAGWRPRGVVHSFSAHPKQLEESLSRGLYIGLNGIMTFTQDSWQLAAAKLVPIDRLLLETDAPFLTPSPFRGELCEPKHIVNIAEFLAQLRGESVERLASYTTKNAAQLFGL